MMRLAPEMVRIPDASFISWSRLPDGKIPRTAIADLAPDLAVEVISRSNTHKEMDRKLLDYFNADVRQVWYVYPIQRQVHVFVNPEQSTQLGEQQTLDGGDVLPGFTLELARLFAEPKGPAKQ